MGYTDAFPDDGVIDLRTVTSLIYDGSEVTCRKPDTFLLAATFAASLILLRLLLRV